VTCKECLTISRVLRGWSSGGWRGAGGEVRVSSQVKGGDIGPGVTAVSIKNQELSISFKSSKSSGSVSLKVHLFATSKGGLCRSGFKTTPSKK
jgi:hypothetical protein